MKLPESTVQQIRDATARGEMRKSIAARFNVNPKTVTALTKDIEKPFDHRGTRTRRARPKTVRMHREDLDW